MLISFGKKFIFVANTKAASTTIEHLLKKHCDVAIQRQSFGKHFTYKTIVAMFQPVFKSSGIPPEGYFRFGIVREPVSWLVSWYNYRRRDAISPLSPKSSHGVSLDEFLEEAISTGKRKPYANLGYQANKFLDQQGELGTDFLIPLPRLQEDLLQICAALELPEDHTPKKLSKNVSPGFASTNDVAPALRARIKERYAIDEDLYEKAMRREFGSIHDIVRRKKELRAAL